MGQRIQLQQLRNLQGMAAKLLGRILCLHMPLRHLFELPFLIVVGLNLLDRARFNLHSRRKLAFCGPVTKRTF